LIPCALALVLPLAGSSIDLPAANEAGQIVPLQDYRWVPVTVKRTPTLIETSFQVMVGGATVHAELLTDTDFRRFLSHRDYEALEQTRRGHMGGFSHMVQTPGRYRVVILNRPNAPPTQVSYTVRATVDPPASTVSVGISPGRQFVVIFVAMTFLFGTVTWSGQKLLRAWRER
jgi:hypothetical protein